jgi:tRNA(fMet)-specific endonuclease VapC
MYFEANRRKTSWLDMRSLFYPAPHAVRARIRRRAPRDVALSAVVMHELYDGAFKSQRVEKNTARVGGIRLPVVEFDREDARQDGEIRAHLAAKGTPMGPYDVLIAGQARARKLTLITRNTTAFTRVPGLKVEDWQGARPRVRNSS